MKKVISLVLVAVFTLSMAGCATKRTEEEVSTTVEETTAAEVAETTEEAEEVAPADTMLTEISGPIEVEFWHAMNGDHQDILTELTEEFNAGNGMGITVKLVNQGNYGDLSKKIMAGIAAGTLPDLAQAYNNWYVNYLDAVVPLDDYITNETIGFDNFDDIVESYRAENSEFGQYYGLPFNKSTYVYFYNKTLFEEVGVEVPTTWEELEEVSRKITEATGNPALGYDDLPGMFQMFTQQNGGEYITSDAEVKFDSAEGIEAYDFFLSMYNGGVARIAGEDKYLSGPFSNGDVAAYVGSIAGLPYINPNGFELGVAPLQSNVEASAPQSGTNIIMLSEEDENRLATWEYMKFLTSTEATVKWSMATGYLPVRTSGFESEVYQAFLAESEAATAAYAQVEDMYYEAGFDGSYGVRTDIGVAIETALLEGLDAEAAVNSFAKAARAAIGQ